MTTDITNVFDWDFFWSSFGYFMEIVSPFVMLIVAISAVGLLIFVIIRAIQNK